MSRVRTERMRAVVGAIARHQAAHGYAPSVRDVMRAAGFSSTSHAAHWLRACEAADGGGSGARRRASRAGNAVPARGVRGVAGRRRGPRSERRRAVSAGRVRACGARP